MSTHARVALLLAISAFAASSFGATPAPRTSCVACHTNSELFDKDAVAAANNYERDVHAKVGLSCHDCHGGNPDPKLLNDVAAMDASFKANPYTGKPQRGQIPQFCGKCHSSLEYMRRFQPAARVDQVADYWTSRHGKALKKGDKDVPTCVDCHGVHGIREVASTESSVHPSRVASTCSHCHSDPVRMKGHVDAIGNPLPIDQFARWRRSVHAAALIDKGDLSAPTCNDCHGNHGAAPPGVDSAAFSCGQCHGREATLLRGSVKEQAFKDHNEKLAKGGGSCGGCHEQLGDVHMARFAECATCHEGHGVIRPTVALLGNLPETPCAFCHEASGPLARTELAEPAANLELFERVRKSLLDEAAARQLDGDRRFDWLVDQALGLPNHTLRSEGSDNPTRLRPEFSRLFNKFRIGKTHYTYADPLTGNDVSVVVRSCAGCHRDPEATGFKTSKAFISSMHDVTSAIARSERILLMAQRGGVETRNVRGELDQALDGQIELEVLVHGFSSEAGFKAKREEALKHGSAALELGRASLRELTNRRKGLSFSLLLVGALLAALALKIRSLAHET